MSPGTAALLVSLFILGLFWLDHDRNVHTSKALWLSVIWLSLAGSRSVGQWLGLPSAAKESLEQYSMEGNPVDRFVYAGLVAVGLFVLARRRQVAKIVRANVPIAFFFLYCAASVLWSDYPDLAFKRWTKALGDLVMVLVVLTERNRVGAIKRLFARTAFLLIPLSILFIKYYPAIGRGVRVWEWTSFYTGVTTNKNALGMISMLCGLASLWRSVGACRMRGWSAGIRHSLSHGIIVAMAVWLCWVANSITALGCLLFAGALLVMTSFRKAATRPIVVHVLVAAVILVPFSTLFLGVGANVAGGATGRNISTLTDRTQLWKDTLSLAENPLIGTGFESFWLGPRLRKLWTLYWWGPTEAHNGYLEVFLNLGWLGIALLAIVIVTGYRTVTVALSRNLPEGNLMLAFFAMGIVYNFTEAAIFTMMSPAWIIFLLAMAKVPSPQQPRIHTLPQEMAQYDHRSRQRAIPMTKGGNV